jgi:hypothetical protein
MREGSENQVQGEGCHYDGMTRRSRCLPDPVTGRWCPPLLRMRLFDMERIRTCMAKPLLGRMHNSCDQLIVGESMQLLRIGRWNRWDDDRQGDSLPRSAPPFRSFTSTPRRPDTQRLPAAKATASQAFHAAASASHNGSWSHILFGLVGVMPPSLW